MQQLDDLLFSETGIVDYQKLFLNKYQRKEVKLKKPPTYAYWLVSKYVVDLAQMNNHVGVSNEIEATNSLKVADKTSKIDKLINEIIDKNITQETLEMNNEKKRFVFIPTRIHMQKIIIKASGWKPMKKD